MKLSPVNDRLFKGLQRPVKRYLASEKVGIPIDIEFALPDYAALFYNFLKGNITDEVTAGLLINELNTGAEYFAHQVMAIFYQPNNKNHLPNALKKIAKKAETYPLISELLITFCKQYISSVDVVDDFGESAFSKIVKADKTRKTPLLFLAKHGAKHCLLTSDLQDSLLDKHPDIYVSSKANTEKWGEESSFRGVSA